jgi:beta-galactosidase
VQSGGGEIVFKSITGKAEVWLDGKRIGTKAGFDAAPLAVTIDAGPSERTISVLLEAQPGHSAGLGGEVLVETAP